METIRSPAMDFGHEDAVPAGLSVGGGSRAESGAWLRWRVAYLGCFELNASHSKKRCGGHIRLASFCRTAGAFNHSQSPWACLLIAVWRRWNHLRLSFLNPRLSFTLPPPSIRTPLATTLLRRDLRRRQIPKGVLTAVPTSTCASSSRLHSFGRLVESWLSRSFQQTAYSLAGAYR